MEEIYRSQFRLPQSLYEELKAAAGRKRRSLNAEIVERLESTFAIEKALRHIAAEAPLFDVAEMLIDLAQERDQAIRDLNDMNLEVHAHALSEQFNLTSSRLNILDDKLNRIIEKLGAEQSPFD